MSIEHGDVGGRDADAAMLQRRAACKTLTDALCAAMRHLPTEDVNPAGLQNLTQLHDMDHHCDIIEQQGNADDFMYTTSLVLEVMETWDERALGLLCEQHSKLTWDADKTWVIERQVPPYEPTMRLFMWDQVMLDFETSPQRSERSVHALWTYYERLGQRVFKKKMQLAQEKARLGLDSTDEEQVLLGRAFAWVSKEAYRLKTPDQWHPRQPFKSADREAAWQAMQPSATPAATAAQGSRMTAKQFAQELVMNRIRLRSMQVAQVPIDNVFDKAGANWSGYYYNS